MLVWDLKCTVILLILLSLSLAEQSPNSDTDRKWFPFPFRLPKPPPEVEQFWTHIPTHAKNFLDNILPKPLRNLFPSAPSGLDSTEGYQRDESHSNPVATVHRTRQASEEQPYYRNERGQLHGPGRDAVKNIERQFSNLSNAVETDDNFFNGILNGFREQVKAIYPGTQWCGDGNRARSDEELGLFFKTDGCCRQHDSCPDYIEKESAKYGLYNGGLFTRSHCDCDQNFYECLKEADDMISGQIGTAYFTALGPQCFRLDKKIIDCKTKKGLTNRCVEYQYDENSTEKIYQWFDNPEF